jgi:sterol O-acyltransferase
MDDNIDHLIDSLRKLKDSQKESQKQKIEILKTFQNKIKTFDNQSKNLLDKLKDIQQEIYLIENDENNIQNLIIVKNQSKQPLNYKRFYLRESVLTELFKKNDYITIYNIFLSILFLLLGNFIFSLYLNEKKELFKFELFSELFEGFSKVMINTISFLWISLTIIIVLDVMIIKNLNNTIKMGVFGAIIFFLFINFFNFIDFDNLSLLCKMIITVEKLRCIFKLISYFCEKVLFISYTKCSKDSKIRNKGILELIDNGESLEFCYKKHDILKELKNYTYFYFAPTMIYRDRYPVKKYSSLYDIAVHIMNIILGLIFAFLLFELVLIPYFQDKNLTFLRKENILQTLVNFIIVSLAVVFVIFFSFGHSYLNVFADLIGFGDRKFYGAFWNASSPVKFYQRLSLNWYEFYKYYIYYVLEKHCGTLISDILNILIFAFSLEYVFYKSLDFFFPIVTILIFFSHVLTFLFKPFKTEKKILLTWHIVSFGSGIMVLILLTHYYVKSNNDYNYTQMIKKLILNN